MPLFASDPVIEGLPERLERVPLGPFSAQDPWRDDRRLEYREWKEQVIGYGDERRYLCSDDGPNYVSQRANELQKCALSAKYFTTVWGHLFEPRARKRRKGLGGRFIPFAKQVELFDAIGHCLTLDEDGPLTDLAVPKARDVGASWICCAQSVHDWLFVPETEVRFISYKEEFVDDHKPDALFWKVDYLLRHLPEWMKPGPTEYLRNKRLLVNYLNGNVIAGETTTSRSGRAGRCSYFIADEASQFEDFGDFWTNTVASADTRIAVSSISLEFGDEFYRLAMDEEFAFDEQPQRLPIHWFDHPLHDDHWHTEIKKSYRLKPGKFEQEVEMNPFAENRQLVYPEFHFRAISDDVVFDLRYPQFCSLDPGVRDRFAVVMLQENPIDGFCDILDCYTNFGKPAEFYGEFLSGRWGDEADGWLNPTAFLGDPELARLADWQRERHLHGVAYFGDVAGWQAGGASAEAVYTVLGRYGVMVRRDIVTVPKQLGGSGRPALQQAREAFASLRGRQDAVRALFPRLRFANTPGARLALKACREYRYKHGDDALLVHEESQPLHNWASHIVTAIEYYAVNREIELSMVHVYDAPNRTPASRGASRAPRNRRPQRARRGSQR